MKRKATDSNVTSKPKRQREPEPDYCDTPLRRDADGNYVWPAPSQAIEAARGFLKEWCVDCVLTWTEDADYSRSASAAAQEKTLIVPDKDADGLDAGVIIFRTLTALGLPPALIDVHLVNKGSNIHNEAERLAMQEKNPAYLIVVDQGSRSGPPVVDTPKTKSLIIDHHLSDEFPENAMVCSYPVHYCLANNGFRSSRLVTIPLLRPQHC